MSLDGEYRKVVSDLEESTLIQVFIGGKNYACPIINEITRARGRRISVKVRGSTTV
jgi:hypothetical protein